MQKTTILSYFQKVNTSCSIEIKKVNSSSIENDNLSSLPPVVSGSLKTETKTEDPNVRDIEDLSETSLFPDSIKISNKETLNDFDKKKDDEENNEEVDNPEENTFDYEQLRANNIRRNAEFLASLGLGAIMPSLPQKPFKPIAKKRKIEIDQSTVRRSSRTSGLPPVSYTFQEQNYGRILEAEDVKEEEIEHSYYDDSSVLKYLLSTQNSSTSCVSDEASLTSIAYGMHPSSPGQNFFLFSSFLSFYLPCKH